MTSKPEKKSSSSQTPTADRLRLALVKPGVKGSKKINDPDLTREEFDKIADDMFDKLYGGLNDSKA